MHEATRQGILGETSSRAAGLGHKREGVLPAAIVIKEYFSSMAPEDRPGDGRTRPCGDRRSCAEATIMDRSIYTTRKQFADRLPR
jgi:hypothetical protein